MNGMITNIVTEATTIITLYTNLANDMVGMNFKRVDHDYAIVSLLQYKKHAFLAPNMHHSLIL